MNYTHAKSRFKHKHGIATDRDGRPVLKRNKLTDELELIPMPERIMREPAASIAVPSKPRVKQRAKRLRLNPGRRTVEENRRAR